MDLPINYSTTHWAVRKEARNQYVRLQKELCYHCKESLKDGPPNKITNLKVNWRLFPKGFLNHPIHLHHDHSTDKTLGAVHAYCNAVLWQYHGE